MLAMIARRVPVMATFSASLVDSCAWPFSILTSTSAGLAIDSVPFGPLTLPLSAWTFNSTPFGRAIGFLATRDISMTPLGHEAQAFTADAPLAPPRVGPAALPGGEDGDRQRALRALDADALGLDVQLHTLRQGDRLLGYSGHFDDSLRPRSTGLHRRRPAGAPASRS